MTEVWLVLIDGRPMSAHETEDLAYVAGAELMDGCGEREFERLHGEEFGKGALTLQRFQVEEDQ